MRTMHLGILVALALCLPGRPAAATVSMPAIFGDNMVLQQDQKLPVWGTAAPSEAVTVTVGGESAKATADAQGQWRVDLAPLKRGGAALTMTIAGAANTLTFTNVLIGEVWVCSGQSNMEFPLQRANNGTAAVAAARQPEIRLFLVTKKVADQPQADVQGRWTAVSPQTAAGFSAVGYFFGRELQQKLDAPVGLIGSYWGGTPAEAWTSRSALEGDETQHSMLTNADKRVGEAIKNPALYEQQLKQWEAATAKAKTENKPAPRKPSDPAKDPHNPAVLYNGMLAPLIPYGIRGAIWYQGESNAGQPLHYASLFPTMIRDWRARWGEGDFTFLFVQLANYEPGGTNWAWLRESQTRTLALPHTGMALAIDVGEKTDIHPKDKQTVGHRLAVIALHDVYGKSDVVCQGPVFDKLVVEGNQARLKLRHAAGGLTNASTNAPLFLVAGKDRVFHVGQSKVDGDDLLVSSDAVAAPVAVRYAWTGWVDANLHNRDGLPLAPFRTDDWPAGTKE